MIKNLKIAALCLSLLQLPFSHATPLDTLQCRLVLKSSERPVAQSPAVQITTDKTQEYVIQVLVKDSIKAWAKVKLMPQEGEKRGRISFSLYDRNDNALAPKKDYYVEDLFLIMREDEFDIFDIKGADMSLENYVLQCRNYSLVKDNVSELPLLQTREEVLNSLSDELNRYVEDKSEFVVSLLDFHQSFRQMSEATTSFLTGRSKRRRRANQVVSLMAACGVASIPAAIIISDVFYPKAQDLSFILPLGGMVSLFTSFLVSLMRSDTGESTKRIRRLLNNIEKANANVLEQMGNQEHILTDFISNIGEQNSSTLSEHYECLQDYYQQVIKQVYEALEWYRGRHKKNIAAVSELPKETALKLDALKSKAQKLGTRYLMIVELLQSYSPDDWDKGIEAALMLSERRTLQLTSPGETATVQELLSRGSKCPKSFAPVLAIPKSR